MTKKQYPKKKIVFDIRVAISQDPEYIAAVERCNAAYKNADDEIGRAWVAAFTRATKTAPDRVDTRMIDDLRCIINFQGGNHANI